MGYSFGDFMKDVTKPIGAIAKVPGQILGGAGGLGGGGGILGDVLGMTGLPQLAMEGLMIFVGIEVLFKLLDKI